MRQAHATATAMAQALRKTTGDDGGSKEQVSIHDLELGRIHDPQLHTEKEGVNASEFYSPQSFRLQKNLKKGRYSARQHKIAVAAKDKKEKHKHVILLGDSPYHYISANEGRFFLVAALQMLITLPFHVYRGLVQGSLIHNVASVDERRFLFSKMKIPDA